MFSKRSVIFAVSTAFLVGIVATLAIRPVGTNQSINLVASEIAVRAKWRMPLSSPSNLPGGGETPLWLAEAVERASSGAFLIDIYEPGEMVPAFAVTDAVRERKVPAGHTWLGYDQGKIPASALFGATPFGLDPWAYIGWWFFDEGQNLASRIYAEHNMKPLLCGISGPETAGWFRQPIETADDINGLKIRFAGIGGKVLQRIGASITMLPSGEIFQALETGVIDATEYSQPITDQALGFARIAKYNYFPGWHQPFSASHLVVNLGVWNEMSPGDQRLLEGLCTAATARHLGLTEAVQGAVIENFPSIGVTANVLPDDLLALLRSTTKVVLDEEAAKDVDFAEVLQSQRAFQQTYAVWRKLAYPSKEL